MSKTSPFRFKTLPRPTAPSATVPVDRFNRVIEAGQLVLHKDIVFQVVGIAPLMDPRAPKGWVRLQLRTEVPVTFEAGVPCSQLVVVADAPPKEETKPAETPSGLVLTDPPAPPSTEDLASIGEHQDD